MMRMWSSLALLFVCSLTCRAEQHAPISIRLVNLGSSTVTALSIQGMPFREVGLDAASGEPLTPEFADGQMDYEIYWRLKDGTVHGETIVLAARLPSTFYGDVVLSIQNDRLGLTWATINPEWVEYSRVGDPRVFARPYVPYYDGCAGTLLENSAALVAWNEAARRTRSRLEGSPDLIPEAISRGRCTLAWYIPRARDRARLQLGETEEKQLRAQWHEDIEKYKQENANHADASGK